MQHSEEEPNEDAKKCYDLLKDAEQPLYEGRTNFRKLSAIVNLYHLKHPNGCSSRELWSKHESLFFFILLYLHSGTFFLLFGKTNVNCVNSRRYVLPISTYFKFYVFSSVLFFSSFPAACTWQRFL